MPSTQRWPDAVSGNAPRAAASPPVAQLAKLEKHRPGIGFFREIREAFPQPGDHACAREPEEGVELLFILERGDDRSLRVMTGHAGKQGQGSGVFRLERQREPQIVLD